MDLFDKKWRPEKYFEDESSILTRILASSRLVLVEPLGNPSYRSNASAVSDHMLCDDL
jgi:hypothetical protein